MKQTPDRIIYAHYVRVSRDAVSFIDFIQSPKSNRNFWSMEMGFRVFHKLCDQLGEEFQMLTLDYGDMDGGSEAGLQITT